MCRAFEVRFVPSKHVRLIFPAFESPVRAVNLYVVTKAVTMVPIKNAMKNLAATNFILEKHL
jgi:hypothetical protein